MAQKARFERFRSWSHPSLDSPMIRGQMWPDWRPRSRAMNNIQPTSLISPQVLSAHKSCDRVRRRHGLAGAVTSPLELDLAVGEPFRPDHDLPGNADQVGRGECGSAALFGVVVEHVHALG